MKHLTRGLAIVAAALLSFGAFAQSKTNIFVASGPTTGVYYPLGGGLADVLTKYIPNLNATAGTTDGSMANLLLIGQSKADVAVSMADASWDAYKGQGKFQDKPVNVRALMVLYPIFSAVQKPAAGRVGTERKTGRVQRTGPGPQTASIRRARYGLRYPLFVVPAWKFLLIRSMTSSRSSQFRSVVPAAIVVNDSPPRARLPSARTSLTVFPASRPVATCSAPRPLLEMPFADSRTFSSSASCSPARLPSFR